LEGFCWLPITFLASIKQQYCIFNSI
jgi:hypothetical protein